jgi:hypothetical protein
MSLLTLLGNNFTRRWFTVKPAMLKQRSLDAELAGLA